MNRHIRFNDFDDDNDNDNQIDVKFKNNSTTKLVDNLVNFRDEVNKDVLTIILRKDFKNVEKSFGFQLSGNQNEKGNHYVSHVETNSPSYKANLKCLDKIIKINGVDVKDYSINSLIDYLDYEMSLNEYKLVLTIERSSASSSKTSMIDNNVKSEKNIENEKNKQTSRQKVLTSREEIDFDTIKDSVSNETDQLNQSISVKTKDQIRIEKIDDVKFFAPERPFKKFNVPSKNVLNSKAKEIQIKLSEQSKYVNWKEIIYELLEYYECQHIGQLDLKQADNLEVINNLLRLQKKIDSFIISYDSRVACVCLIDLEEAICHDYNYTASRQIGQCSSHNKTQDNFLKINKFDEIHMGPLIQNQIIRQLFKIPDNVNSIRNLKPIKLLNVMKHLHSYLDTNNIWSKKVNIDEFEQSLVEKYKTGSINELCVKINNIGLLVGSIKNVQHIYSNSLRNVRASLTSELEQLIENEKSFLIKTLNEKLKFYEKEHDNYELDQIKTRLNYLNIDSVSLVVDFLKIFENLFDKDDFEPISNFLYSLKSNKFLADAFQIAISFARSDYFIKLIEIKFDENTGDDKYTYFLKRIFEMVFKWRFEQYENRHKKLAKDIRRFFNAIFCRNGIQLHAATSKKYFDDEIEADLKIIKSNEKNENENNKVNLIEEDFDKKLANFIKNKLEPYSELKFEHLIKLENDLFEKNSYNFMELLFKNKFLLENLNIKIVLLEKEKADIKMNDRIEIKEIFNFIQKAKLIFKKMNLEDDLFHAKLIDLIQLHYSVRSLDQLGYGNNIKTLIDQADNQKLNQIINIVYHHSLIYSTQAINKMQSEMEYSSIEDKHYEILDLLSKCPLLENIYEFLNWEEEYKTKFGKIKDFINSLNETSSILKKKFQIDILELEYNEKSLYKLTCETDVNIFKFSIENGDFINAAGHLVSLIYLKYGSLDKTPCSLLINEIKSSLTVYFNKCGNEQNYNEYLHLLNRSLRLRKEFYFFIIEFIFRIPVKLLVQIIFIFIIDPLINLEGNSDVKKDIFIFSILRAYLSNENYYKFNAKNLNIIDERVKHLIRLGKACCITEWSKENYHSVLNTFIEKAKKTNAAIDEKFEIQNKEKICKIFQVKETIEENLKQDTNYADKKICEMPKELFFKKSEPNEYKNQFEHIKSIRRRYGVGIDINDQIKLVTDSLKGVIGRSLESLSNELYNKDMHFVLELIQNADDNNYEKDFYSEKIEPTLIFILEENQITLLNNEIGFKEQNINAICDVKASTKGKHQRGCIGRKGIGFKSVFTLTDCPEIYSNGYQINFDLKNGHIGYILPNWISNNDMLDQINKIKRYTFDIIGRNSNDLLNKIGNLNTVIRLPFRSKFEKNFHKSVLINNFTDVKPYLLLFLNRLRNLIIINKIDNNEIIYHRSDINENLIEIISNQINESSKWLVVKQVIKLPSNLTQNESVESTDLCLAYPIDKMENCANLPKMDVFAYLPLRSYGFKFIIQADFLVPASRQDINQDSEWNQYICKELPKLIIQSIKYFNQHPNFNGDRLKALKAFLRFIPLEEEIVGFFSYIPGEVIEILKNEPFLPVQGDIDGEILWKKPTECVIVKNDEFIRQVLTSDLLKKYLGSYYLHSEIVNFSETDQRLFYKLGVKILSLNDILEILKIIFVKNDFKDIKTTSKWLVVLDHCLNNHSIQKEEIFLQQLRQFEFIPILKRISRCKDMVNLKKIVFFPLSVQNSDISNKIANVIENELDVLDIQSLLCLDNVKNAQIVNFLKILGVKQIKSNEIIDLLKNQSSYENITEQSSINYAIFLHDVFYSNNSNASSYLIYNLEKIKENLTLKTNKGFKKIIDDDTIFLSTTYGNQYDLKTMFPSYDWCMLDSIYIDKSVELYQDLCIKKDKLAQSLRKFFITLGLNDLFLPKLRQKIVKHDELDKYENYDQYSSLLKITKLESYIFNDYECQVFDHYINLSEKLNSSLIEELTNLFRLIEQNWEDILSKFKYVSVEVVKQDEIFNLENSNKQTILTLKENICETKYFRNLKSKSWICVETNDFFSNSFNSKILNNFEKNTHIRLETPSKAFIREEVFKRFYGLHVPYTINSPNKDKSNFGRDLNLNYEFNLKDFLTLFEKWVSTSKIFYASLSQMTNIYHLIYAHLNNFENNEIYRLCKNLTESDKPFIFVPNNNYDNKIENYREKILAGYFVPIKDVYWSDKTNIFEIYRNKDSNYLTNSIPILLEPFYYEVQKGEQTKQIFLNCFNIKNSPSIYDYINLLEEISLIASIKINENEYLRHVFNLFEILVDKCVEMTDSEIKDDKILISEMVKNEFFNLIKNKPVFPCLNNKWMSIKEKGTDVQNQLILVDNEFDLAENFRDKINMIMIPSFYLNETSLHQKDQFKNSCNAESLNHKLKYFFFELLEFKTFKESVISKLENIYEPLYEAPQVQSLCRKILPHIQCYFLYCFKLQYKNFVNINEKLEKMKFYFLNDIQVTYIFLHDQNIRVTISKKSYLDFFDKDNGWVYYVRTDILENVKEIIKGFTKLFLNLASISNESDEKRFVKFCLLLNQYHNSIISEEELVEIESDFNLKLVLPENEKNWYIPEFVQNFKRSIQEIIETPGGDNKLVKKNKTNNIQDCYKKSRKEKVLQLEKISQFQIQDPNLDFSNELQFTTDNRNLYNNFDLKNLPDRKLLLEANIIEENFLSKVLSEVVICKLSILSQQINDFQFLSANNNDNQELRSKIGRWGEFWVYEMLKLKFENELKMNLIKLEWMNEKNESGLPYDLRISRFESDKNIFIKYIEVKSTTKPFQDIFPISFQELIFAQEVSSKYEIFRLYNAGNHDPKNIKLKILKNITHLLNTHIANLYLAI